MSAPVWDLSPYFPAWDGPEYRAYRTDLEVRIRDLDQRSAALGALREGVENWAALLVDLEELTSRFGHLGSYLGCMTAADSGHEGARRDRAALAPLGAAREKVMIRVQAAFREATDAEFAELLAVPALADTGYLLSRIRERAQKTMEPSLEALASDLEVDGLSAWGRLYDQVAGRLEFEMDGRKVPMALKRSLTENPDPAVRQAAQEGSNAAWAAMEDVAAASLNAISGTRLTLYRWRGVEHFLDVALFDSGITRKTLDAMFTAVRERRELPQSYLRRKASLLGVERLGFHDLSAPLPLPDPRPLDWTRAADTVLRSFATFDPALGDFARQAFERRWIDAEVRPGKRPGGFCSSSMVIRESRIFMTYNDTLGDLRTLAHELGHAWHNQVMRDLRPWARRYPMTLAETASTFAESVLTEALLENPATPLQDKAVLLDGLLEHAATYLLNIPMRFLFEHALYEERSRGELTVSRLKEMMLEAQRECYGDVLATWDEYFWASKLHFYITGVSFYNFPYTFGYLFSLGVYARARQEGPDFLVRLLRETGRDTAEGVARRTMGVDLESPDFWHASIDVVERDLARFEEVVPGVVGQVLRND